MKNRIFSLLICTCLLLFLFACGNAEVMETERLTNGADVPLTPITAPETETPIPSEKRISFIAVGDNIPHDSVINTAKADAVDGKKYDFSKIYAGIAAEVEAADIAFINQESPVGGESLGISGYPNFNAPSEMIDELIKIGFDVFNIANNHMLDKREKGYANTVEYFNTLPITMIGGYTKSDYDNLRIIDKNGIKTAFLSYTTFVNSGHSNDISSGSDYIIPYANTADITRQVTLAKEKADVVIVSMHWGAENKASITSEQTKYAKLCADLGVDVVIGHHSHIPGKVEWMSGESGNKTLVTYSLGNFCSSQLYAKNMIGEMLKFDIVKDADGVVSIENAYIDPVVCHYKTDTSKKDNQDLHVRYEVRMYMLKDYTEQMSNAHGSQNWGKFSFANLKAYITDVVPEEFLR